MFSVYPKFRINLNTLNLDKTLIHEFENKDLMNKGDKAFSVTYMVAYAISNSVHSIEYAKQEYIELDEVFSDIGNIEKNEFCELFPDEENWTIDLTKDKRYYGQPKSRYEVGRSSTSSLPESNTELIRQLSYKMDKIGKAIGFME